MNGVTNDNYSWLLKITIFSYMSNKFYDFPFYKWEKEKANDPFLRQPFGDNWEIYTVFTNPVASENTGFPHKFGYSVNLSDNYLSISSPFYNDGLVYVYSLNSSNLRQSSKPIHTIDVRDLGDVEGCYAEGPNKFGFGISTSFNNGKLLIGSLKDYENLIKNKLISSILILIPSLKYKQRKNLSRQIAKKV